MTTITRKLISPVIALSVFGMSSNVFAGGAGVGSIVYGSGTSTPVPTLGGSALIVLALLLAVVAFRILRTQQHKGVNLVVALTAVTALASGVGGVRLVSDAHAIIPVASVDMDSESGGTAALFPGINEVTNVTNVPLSILKITVASGCSIDDIRPNGGGNGGNGGIGVDAIEAQANGGGNFVGNCDDNPSTTVPAGDFCGLIITCDE